HIDVMADGEITSRTPSLLAAAAGDNNGFVAPAPTVEPPVEAAVTAEAAAPSNSLESRYSVGPAAKESAEEVASSWSLGSPIVTIGTARASPVSTGAVRILEEPCAATAGTPAPLSPSRPSGATKQGERRLVVYSSTACLGHRGNEGSRESMGESAQRVTAVLEAVAKWAEAGEAAAAESHGDEVLRRMFPCSGRGAVTFRTAAARPACMAELLRAHSPAYLTRLMDMVPDSALAGRRGLVHFSPGLGGAKTRQGNGTEGIIRYTWELFRRAGGIVESGDAHSPFPLLFASTHQFFEGSEWEEPFFPGTGRVLEKDDPAHEYIVNCPLPPYSSGADFRAAFTQTIVPRLRAFKPDLVLVRYD
ncbi:hypothetical protein HK405_001722, partial [Cladochytrium tenue]